MTLCEICLSSKLNVWHEPEAVARHDTLSRATQHFRQFGAWTPCTKYMWDAIIKHTDRGLLKGTHRVKPRSKHGPRVSHTWRRKIGIYDVMEMDVFLPDLAYD